MSRAGAAQALQATCLHLADSVGGLTQSDVKSLLESKQMATLAANVIRPLLRDGLIERAGESRRDAKGKLEEVYVLSTKGWRAFARHPNNPHREEYQ
jgi:hypothetical protein